MPSLLGDSRAPFSLLDDLVLLGVGVVVPELGAEDFFSDVFEGSVGLLGVDNRSKIAFLLLLDCVEFAEPADLSDLAESVVEERFRGLSATFESLSELLLLGVLDLGTSKGTKPGIVPAILAGRGFLGALISRGLAGLDTDVDMWSPIVLLGRWGVAGARKERRFSGMVFSAVGEDATGGGKEKNFIQGIHCK